MCSLHYLINWTPFFNKFLWLQSLTTWEEGAFVFMFSCNYWICFFITWVTCLTCCIVLLNTPPPPSPPSPKNKTLLINCKIWHCVGIMYIFYFKYFYYQHAYQVFYVYLESAFQGYNKYCHTSCESQKTKLSSLPQLI